MSDPARLVVDPRLVADVGRRLAVLTSHLDGVSAHLRGPSPAPPVGEVSCAFAYQGAQHQLSGLISTTVVEGAALVGALLAAARTYATVDREAVGSQAIAGIGAETPTGVR